MIQSIPVDMIRQNLNQRVNGDDLSPNDTQADIIGSEECTIFEACTQVENAFNRAEAPWPKLY